MNKGYEWGIDIDIEQFFDKGNHDKLIQILKVANSRLGWYRRSGINVVNFIISKDLLENRMIFPILLLVFFPHFPTGELHSVIYVHIIMTAD